MISQLVDSYLDEEQLRALGIGSVGANVRISSSSLIIGIENIHIGNNVRIDAFSTMLATGGGSIVIGSNVHIGGYCYLSGKGGIEIQSFAGLSQGVRIYSATDDYSGKYLTNPTVPPSLTNVVAAKVCLCKHVIIGSSSVVLPGITAGEGAAVGALSLVTKNLEQWSIYFGSPVKKIKSRSTNALFLERQYLDGIPNANL